MIKEWKEYRFDEIAKFPPKIKMKKGNNYPFIPMENLDGNTKFAKPLIEKELKGGGAKFEEGDTLFSRITPCLQNGKIAQAKDLNNKSGFGSTEYFIFRGIEGVSNSDFIYYLSKTYWFRQHAINSMVGASGRQRADAGFVRNLKINLPPLPIQRKIATILSAYDDLIENNLKRIKLLEEKAKLTYEEWFVRMRFPGHETTKIDEETGLPEGWEKMKLNLMTDYIGRGISPNYVDSDGISIVNQKCIRNNRVNRDLIRLSHKEKNISQEKRLQSLDILVNSTGTGTLGRVAQIFSVKEKMSVDTHVTIVRGNSKDSKIFLGRTIEYNQPRIENVGKGSTNQIELSRKDLGNIEVNSPIKSLRVKFDKMFMPNYEAIEKLTQSNKLLKEARDILLPRLMTGMIDVS